MSSIASASVSQAQTQMSLSTTMLKKAYQAEEEVVATIQEAAQKAPPPGMGTKVDEVA